MSPVVSPACSRAGGGGRLGRPGTAVVFLGGAAVQKTPVRAIPPALREALRRAPSREKSANHFSPLNAGGGMGGGGEGLKPHGRTASTGEAESGAEPGPRSPSDVQPLPPPLKAVSGHLDPLPKPAGPVRGSRRGEGAKARRRAGRRGGGSCLKVSHL